MKALIKFEPADLLLETKVLSHVPIRIEMGPSLKSFTS